MTILERVYIHRNSLSIGITVLSAPSFSDHPNVDIKNLKRKMKTVAGHLEFERVTEMRGQIHHFEELELRI